jgi:uncharacterized protein YjgD (DUF1641 family)
VSKSEIDVGKSEAAEIISDEDLRAVLQDLVELEKSGTLDVAVIAVKKMDELLQYLFQEPALFRLLAILLDGSLGAMRQLDAEDVIELKGTVQNVGGCIAKSLGEEKIRAAKPLGLSGLLKAMGDPEVKKGIGVTVELLKALGRCASSTQKANQIKPNEAK